MYVRNDGTQDLTLVVSGMLWQRSLVMQDQETKSLWSHLLGKSMDGKLKGTQLKAIPALLTDWNTWKTNHPQTTAILMSRTMTNFKNSVYRDLSGFVVGMTDQDKSKAWSFADLKSHPLVNDSFGESSVVIYFDDESSTPFVFDRKLDEQALTFEKNDSGFVDKETSSVWDLKRGIATEGSLKGKRLALLVGISSFRQAWKNFYPGSEYWKPVN